MEFEPRIEEPPEACSGRGHLTRLNRILGFVRAAEGKWCAIGERSTAGKAYSYASQTGKRFTDFDFVARTIVEGEPRIYRVYARLKTPDTNGKKS